MGKLKGPSTCISRIDIMKPANIEVINLLINNNNNVHLLLRKRMFENIRRGLIREALLDAGKISIEDNTIESRLIVSRLWLCLGEVSKALKELNICIDCGELCSLMLEITRIDLDFVNALMNKLDSIDIVRQDYVIQSLTYSNEEYLWVDFMPYIISLLNNNRDEGEDWLRLLSSTKNKSANVLAEEILINEFNLFNEYKGLFHFIKWAENKDIKELEKVVQSTYFPDGIYVFAKVVLGNNRTN